MNRTLIVAVAFALLTVTAHAGGAASANTTTTTTTPKPVATPRPPAPPGYHYGLGNVLHADCVVPPTSTTGGKASVSFPGCTEDGANVGTTTQSAAKPKP